MCADVAQSQLSSHLLEERGGWAEVSLLVVVRYLIQNGAKPKPRPGLPIDPKAVNQYHFSLD
jgi:hypothetical protein